MKISAMLQQLLSNKYISLFFLLFNIHFAIAFSETREELDKFLKQKCLTLNFLEISVFEDEINKYAGKLIRNGNVMCIIYPENDFFVLKNSRIVKIKNGNEQESYELDEFPNPLLRILFFINRWRDFFEVFRESDNTYKLIPKDDNLKENIAYILVKMDNGNPRVIKIVSDPTNYVTFKILKTYKSCKIDTRCNF